MNDLLIKNRNTLEIHWNSEMRENNTRTTGEYPEIVRVRFGTEKPKFIFSVEGDSFVVELVAIELMRLLANSRI